MLSSVIHFFVAAYSTEMRGGCLRFQAQYLRRIRLPHWQDVPIQIRDALSDAAENRDRQSCNHHAYRLFGLNPQEQALLERQSLYQGHSNEKAFSMSK